MLFSIAVRKVFKLLLGGFVDKFFDKKTAIRLLEQTKVVYLQVE